MIKARVNTIFFTVIYEGNTFRLETYPHEYRNLMLLLSDKIFPDFFGECGGQGRCGTCTVKIFSEGNLLNETNRNEEATLHKLDFYSKDLRLSCQLLIDENLNNQEFEIISPW